MPVEKSAGAVVFYRDGGSAKLTFRRAQRGGKIKYLLIQHGPDGNWGFPKGLIEKGEDLKEAAKREVWEETGLKDTELEKNFKETKRYYFKVEYEYQLSRGWKMGEGIMKFVTYFLARSKIKDVKISFEHSDFEWLGFKAATDRLKFKTDKEILKKANDFLNRISKKSIQNRKKNSSRKGFKLSGGCRQVGKSGVGARSRERLK